MNGHRKFLEQCHAADLGKRVIGPAEAKVRELRGNVAIAAPG
jgi:hypothetical protein